jgi:hypothetical protein
LISTAVSGQSRQWRRNSALVPLNEPALASLCDIHYDIPYLFPIIPHGFAAGRHQKGLGSDLPSRRHHRLAPACLAAFKCVYVGHNAGLSLPIIGALLGHTRPHFR